MVMLKVLQQYYMATGDERVVELMLSYFNYQLKQLPLTPLDHWSFWGNRRGGDNLMMVYWVYNITGEPFLLELAELLTEQTFPYTQVFLKGETLNGLSGFHCVNLAQGIKQPIIYYQQHPEQKHIDAVNKAFADIRKYHGQPQGMYGGDEPLHGTNPTQGSELCSTVEMMYSLESMIPITENVKFADHLEQLTFNSLPAQIKDDFSAKQYFQQPNQVMATEGYRNFFTDHKDDLVFGITTGYPCCLTNMHQGWPKFVQNLWYATRDSGLAALVYAPNTVKTNVGKGQSVTIRETTHYPFDNRVVLHVECKNSVQFPLYVRIPGWCNQGSIIINDKVWKKELNGCIVKIDRTWQNKDRVELVFPMDIVIHNHHENSISVERGPLVYALKIKEQWNYVTSKDDPPGFWEIRPKSDWNFGIKKKVVDAPEQFIKIEQKQSLDDQPWNIDNAPISLILPGVQIADWKLYNNMAGPLPASGRKQREHEQVKPITLIPYGCTKLRISEFPVIR